MDKYVMKDKLTAVINALNNTEVKGMANLNNLIGCLHILQEILQELTTDKDEEF